MSTDSNLHHLNEYKTDVINLLYRNDNFINLINPSPSECPDLDIIDVLNGGSWIIDGKKWTEQGHVFDFNFVDETVTQDKTFVFVDTNVETIRDNTLTDFKLAIYIFSAKTLIRLNSTTVPTAKEVKQMGYAATTQHGNRIDALCECVDEIINGSNKLKSLGCVKPTPRNHVLPYHPKNEYYGKCLQYVVTGYQSGGSQCDYR